MLSSTRAYTLCHTAEKKNKKDQFTIIVEKNEALSLVLDRIREGYFSHGDTNLFMPLLDELINQDQSMLLADYQSYVDCQDKVSETWCHQELWTRMSILNVARIGKFSSDRAIQEYCREIWKVNPVPV